MAQVALLIIDMQNDFVDPRGKLFVAGAPETVPRLAEVLEAFRAANRPVVFVVREHQPDGADVESVRREAFSRLGGFCLPGSWGAQIVPALAPRPGEPVVRKRAWSAFFGTELDRLLRRAGVDTLVIGGTQTPNCVRATVYDATVYGYRVILLADGTSSPTPERQQANLLDLAELGIEMADCASVASRLQADAVQSPPKPSLRAPAKPEREAFTRAVLDTVRQGDLRLEGALQLPVVSWWARRILHDLFHRRAEPFWFELDGRPAGVLVYRRVRDALRIEALGVFPEARRQGWGLWLLEQAEEEARRRGVARLELQVSSGNLAAFALYLRAGFRPRPRRWTELWLERTVPSGAKARLPSGADGTNGGRS